METPVADLRRAMYEALRGRARIIVQRNWLVTSYTVGMDRLPYSSTLEPDSSLFIRSFVSNVNFSGAGSLVFDPRVFLVSTNAAPTSSTLTLKSANSSFGSIDLYSSASIKVYR